MQFICTVIANVLLNTLFGVSPSIDGLTPKQTRRR